MIPARFQVQRQVLNLLQYILKQPTTSLLFRVFKALENHPLKNDWLSGAKKVLESFEINLSFIEIQQMNPTKFKSIVKNQSRGAAFKYLLDKQENGQKGKHINYTKNEMVDYLLPECSLSVSEKTEIFAFRCEMNSLPNNFGNSDLCDLSCQEPMNNTHLLSCPILNDGQACKLKLEQILNGNIDDKILDIRKLQENTRKLKQ